MTLLLEAIIVSSIGGLISFFWILTKSGDDLPDSVFFMRLFPAGILLIVAMTVVNSFVENKWAVDYILDFLSLKNVGDWFFRMAAFWGYISIIWGFIANLALLIKKFKKNIKRAHKR